MLTCERMYAAYPPIYIVIPSVYFWLRAVLIERSDVTSKSAWSVRTVRANLWKFSSVLIEKLVGSDFVTS